MQIQAHGGNRRFDLMRPYRVCLLYTSWAVCICFVSFSLTALAVSGFLPQEDDSTYYASSRAVIVNINEADISELSLLDGIGYERAKEIVRYRQSHGAFSCAEDIMEDVYKRQPYILLLHSVEILPEAKSSTNMQDFRRLKP